MTILGLFFLRSIEASEMQIFVSQIAVLSFFTKVFYCKWIRCCFHLSGTMFLVIKMTVC